MKVLQIDHLTKTYQGSCEPAVKDFSLDVNQGEIVALLGESGCGKTTLLRLISGFEIPDTGRIIIRDRIVADDRILVPPEKRGVGIVFQDYALFPHKTVSENIRFGLFRLPVKEQIEITAEMIRITGLSGLGKRYPHQLSGGQKQRVALARALAPKPRLILLDEPFSNLDSLKKVTIQEEIAAIIKQTDSTGIFVTHDTKDVLAIADRVVVMKDGLALQTDTPANLYKYPVNEYVARFFGKTNVLPAEVLAEGFLTSLGMIRTTRHTLREGQRVLLSVRPDNFEVARDPENALSAKVIKTNFLGDYKEIHCRVRCVDSKEMDVTIHVPPHEKCDERECFIRYKDHYPPSVLKV